MAGTRPVVLRVTMYLVLTPSQVSSHSFTGVPYQHMRTFLKKEHSVVTKHQENIDI
jgi:hypothetical protein